MIAPPPGGSSDGGDRGHAPEPGEQDPALEWAEVTEHLPNKMLRVRTEGGASVSVHASGAMRVRVTRLQVGERVRIERSPLDPSKGRLTDLSDGV